MHIADRLRLASLRALGFRSRPIGSSIGDLHVLEGTGTGPLPMVVLLHGLSAAGVDWGPLMRRLRPLARRIVAPDLPGHGRSSPPPVHDLPAMQTALQEVLDRLIDDQPALVYGNSLGGLAAVRYAGARPDRVAGLMLSSPAGARTSLDDLHGVLDQFRQASSHGGARPLMKRILPNGHWLGPAMEVGVRVRLRNPFVRELVDGISHEHTLDPQELRRLEMPILLTWGRSERLLPASHLEFYRNHLPDHAVVEEPHGVGHVPYLEDAAAVAHRMRRFWAERLSP